MTSAVSKVQEPLLRRLMQLAVLDIQIRMIMPPSRAHVVAGQGGEMKGIAGGCSPSVCGASARLCCLFPHSPFLCTKGSGRVGSIEVSSEVLLFLSRVCFARSVLCICHVGCVRAVVCAGAYS